MAASAELGPGDTAPDFTLPSTSGSKVTLSSFRETTTVLLAFFPLAFTRVCTAELCDFSEDFSKFKDAGATVFGISVDSIPTLKEFKAKDGLVRPRRIPDRAAREPKQADCRKPTRTG